MRIERTVSSYHPRIGGVETYAHCYRTLVHHTAVSGYLPFVFTLHCNKTRHTEFRKLLHRLCRPAGARPFNAAICASDAERGLVIRAGKTVTPESA